MTAASRAGQPLGIAFALFLEMLLRQFRGECSEAQQRAERLLSLSQEHDLPQYRTWAGIVRGWASARLGNAAGIDAMRDGLAAYEWIGSELSRPHFYGLLADALRHHHRLEEARAAIADALASAERTSERYYHAALFCIEGDLLLESASSGDVDLAARAFDRAIALARHQGAKSVELRAAIGLARVRRVQSRDAEGRAVLAGVYDGFTEGFGTEDLRIARRLLDEPA